jgi:hypothetical protein
MEQSEHRIANLEDTATGYRLEIVRVVEAADQICYGLAVFHPHGSPHIPEGDDGLIDQTVSVALKSDGSGHMPLRERK